MSGTDLLDCSRDLPVTLYGAEYFVGGLAPQPVLRNCYRTTGQDRIEYYRGPCKKAPASVRVRPGCGLDELFDDANWWRGYEVVGCRIIVETGEGPHGHMQISVHITVPLGSDAGLVFQTAALHMLSRLGLRDLVMPVEQARSLMWGAIGEVADRQRAGRDRRHAAGSQLNTDATSKAIVTAGGNYLAALWEQPGEEGHATSRRTEEGEHASVRHTHEEYPPLPTTTTPTTTWKLHLHNDGTNASLQRTSTEDGVSGDNSADAVMAPTTSIMSSVTSDVVGGGGGGGVTAVANNSDAHAPPRPTSAPEAESSSQLLGEVASLRKQVAELGDLFRQMYYDVGDNTPTSQPSQQQQPGPHMPFPSYGPVYDGGMYYPAPPHGYYPPHYPASPQTPPYFRGGNM